MDVIGDITAIRNPLPRPGEVTPADCYPDAYDQAERARAEDTADLQAQCEALEEDPLVLALGGARARKEAADREIRLLLAYGREFHGRRPYPLEDLAAASGMSFSGVRTAYTDTDVETVARFLDRAPDGRRAQASSS
ncbi:hypothetical protein GCM10010129_80640 [Streptomyces fumigatiscleroticus]|nr:hypothetical protein GCM10010129_80640 [Streptomyces fumigatiscleroticus]